MKCGIVVFPGSNCDQDSFHILNNILGLKTEWIWHKDLNLAGFDLVILPGGFSYGDYLRPGAIARFSPVMKMIIDYAQSGGRLLGICNGFQILVECGLLPGALMRNQFQAFICKPVYVRVENNQTPFTQICKHKTILKIPIAHADGNYFAEPDTLKKLEDKRQVIFRYCNENGEITERANPNGSIANIAGITNESRTVLGMMPHPERCADPIMPEIDGQTIFQSLMQSLS